MTTVVTRGAASAQALGYASSSAAVNFIEDVFSTYLYTGNDAALTVTNGIDLSGKGGLVWGKSRSGVQNHRLYDTARGSSFSLISNATSAQSNQGANACAFNADGFSLSAASGIVGSSGFGGPNYVSWTFREQPKFFDIVTFSGTGSQQSINHNLGSVPGCIIVKRTDATSSYWGVYHRSSTDGYALGLNTTEAQFNAPSFFVNSASQTSTQFTVGASANVNASGGTYVAYLFAHNAGGFGLTGTDNVISCGSYTNDAGGNPTTVNLGYEPQWVMFKRTDSDTFGNWYMVDNMRGFLDPSGSSWLWANATNAEQTGLNFAPTSTGFTTSFVSSATFIYIAIRRGPMRVPTDATKVYANSTRSATAPAWTSNFPVDWFFQRTTSVDNWATLSRLTGTDQLRFNTTDAATTATEFKFDFMNGINGSLYADSTDYGWMMRRAPGFFDEVCYTGTGVARTVAHNLAAVPELMIVKSRSGTGDWKVWNKSSLFTNLILNSDVATQSDSINSPTTTTFSAFSDSNTSSVTYVAYLFATCPGVSKVGSYTGTGTTLQINCGFTSGSRFVLIKRTDSTGDWYVWDSARGIVAGNDPYLLLNSTAAENTSTDYVDTYSAGFEISSTAPAAINANGGSFIFFAVA